MSHTVMNDKIIPFDKNYEFTFIEVEDKIKIIHPVSNYFLKLNDLSINLLISLKWILWGHEFLFSISNEIKFINYSMTDLIDNSIQLQDINLDEKQHIILIDNQKIQNLDDTFYLIENFYSKDIFNENTKIHMKLKLNLREYLIIAEVLYPTFIKWDKIETL